MSPERVRAALAAHRARTAWRRVAPRRAAVAVALRWPTGAPGEASGGPEVLLTERAARSGDRWSGQVALPGGHAERADADLVATARRETLEEVALDLGDCADPVGQLDAHGAVARGKVLPMSITPIVFQITGEHAPAGTSAEVSESFWLPLDLAASGAIDERFDFAVGRWVLPLPCWRYEGHTVWGLTYDILRDLLGVLGARQREGPLRTLGAALRGRRRRDR